MHTKYSMELTVAQIQKSYPHYVVVVAVIVTVTAALFFLLLHFFRFLLVAVTFFTLAFVHFVSERVTNLSVDLRILLS